MNYNCEIRQQLIPIGHPNRKGVKINPIAIVVHYTANDKPTATDTNNVKYIGRAYKKINGIFYETDSKTKFRQGSAQWFIDEDSATLCIPQNEVAWGCGDRQLSYNNGYKGQTKIAREIFNHNQNYLTINYELCNNANWRKTCNNAIPIIVNDMITYGIKPEMIFRHHDITGKICPKPFVDNIKEWEEFKNKIILNYMKEVGLMFLDIEKNRWSEKAIERVAKLKIMNGYKDGSFKPTQALTREEAAAIIDNLLKYLGK